jgi:tetratricopeptide (TPR) repeat protein
VFEPFVTQMLDQKSGDRDLRFDQAVIARNRALMEATSGHRAAARENLDLASSRFRDLLKDYPDDHDCRLQFGYTLSCLASWSIENKFPDAEKLLQSALVYLEEYRREFPSEVLAINAIIRVHLAMTMLPGEKYNDEHNRAVLDIVDEFAARGPLSSHLQMMRAHALNNIASTLTNCGKTDEAEFYWLKVLALREEMNRKASQDKICRYELAKCLTNYANQLTKTNRPQNAFKMRERAAGLFDTLNDDARFRATYIPLMVDSDYVLAGFYDKQNSTEKAIARLSNALELNAILLKRDYTPASVKELNADLLTRRAELTQKLARHDQAARDYRAAMEFTTKPPQREYCSARLVQALALSGDLPAAVDLANTLNVAAFSHPYPCLELARSWLLIAKLPNGELGNPVASVRDEITRKALENARQAVLAAKDKGLFQNPNEVRIFHSQKDFELVWDLIPRLTK